MTPSRVNVYDPSVNVYGAVTLQTAHFKDEGAEYAWQCCRLTSARLFFQPSEPLPSAG
ncbi:hypothetical protein ARTHRO9AX_80173 [Arthrobacter sp. 9AX]|nr:hypothetical protein ARTHRO9AX_80173 [Arthrobacter sp. 9AX]